MAKVNLKAELKKMKEEEMAEGDMPKKHGKGKLAKPGCK